ncbi:hypothetical protein M4D56_15200 [Cytobacillus oceanisediminis]|nr:hypothetical protein [Cytobacillus oceanisediminis]MCM3393326.1 hypothetical protein [Cytobacillus oceanisediminis]MCM3401328.1 hypothetical protein [Cytobacillus oceanisediminis]MCM3530425.1 hypothetical protein [Cytobacillus oceanisediminis]MDK7665627.1 hypothetical protein [Cytobacillus oceanisediminis]
MGSVLSNMSMEWLSQFKDVEDYFIYVSNRNTEALEFYTRKGFTVSHEILDGFITVSRANKKGHSPWNRQQEKTFPVINKLPDQLDKCRSDNNSADILPEFFQAYFHQQYPQSQYTHNPKK